MFHVSLLKRYNGGPSWVANTRQSTPVDDTVDITDVGDEVDMILRTRTKRVQQHRQRQYLVQWKDRQEHDATWVEESRIRSAQACIDRFWERRPDVVATNQHGMRKTLGTTSFHEGGECDKAPQYVRRSRRKRCMTERMQKSREQEQARKRRSGNYEGC